MVVSLYGSFEPATEDIYVERKQDVIETGTISSTFGKRDVSPNLRFALISIAAICLFASPLILNSTSIVKNENAAYPILSLLIGDTLFQGSNSKTDVDFETYFGLIRKGYESSAHFGSSKDEVVRYAFLDKYNTLIEPYAEMEIVLLSDDDIKEIDSLEFEICSAKDESNCEEGEFSVSSSEVGSFTIECDPFDEYTVSIKGFDSSGDKIMTSTGDAVCVYVRREIQTLTGGDLDATLNAMHTLWTTSEEEGQKKYGENYHSAEYFTAAHHFNAGQQESDHIHEGVGFIAQHIKLTNVFEKAMQAVDPSVSLPYWDFTKDAAEGKSIFDTAYFSAKMFGSIVAPSDTKWGFRYSADDMRSAVIPDGRWANLKALRTDMLANPYGYMRGPWNMNPNPYVSRFAMAAPPLPTCDTYYNGLLMSEYDEFLTWAPFDPHAPIHAGTGGTFGCDKFDQLKEMGLIPDDLAQRTICAEWNFTIKDLYRGGYIVPETGCETDDLSDEGITCKFTCPDTYYDEIPSKLSQTVQGVDGKLDLTDEQWEVWRDFVCEGDGAKVFVGDHLESASTYDPSFWPMHPTLERLVQLKYIAGQVSSYVWPTDPKETCDKSSCVIDGVKAEHAMCCYGHYEDDQMLDFENEDATSYVGPTNGETMKGTDPTSEDYSMPYVYEHFEWSHCVQDLKSAARDIVLGVDAPALTPHSNKGREKKTVLPSGGTSKTTTNAATTGTGSTVVIVKKNTTEPTIMESSAVSSTDVLSSESAIASTVTTESYQSVADASSSSPESGSFVSRVITWFKAKLSIS